MEFSALDGRTIRILEGDLTEQGVDAIVNAANETLLGGAGVDGAIHRGAGPELLAHCRTLPESAPGVRCPTGEARWTPGFALPARGIVHTVGPVYESAAASAPLLRAAHENALAIADAHGARSVAFPAISCGVFGYPAAEAAPLALKMVLAFPGAVSEVRFVLFGEPMARVWRTALRGITGS